MGFLFVIVNSIVYASWRGNAISPSKNPVRAVSCAKPCIFGFHLCSFVSPSFSMSRRSSAVIAVDLRGNEISVPVAAAVPSRHRCDSCSSDEVVGGSFFDFERISGDARRLDGVSLVDSHAAADGLLSTASSASSGSCMSDETHWTVCNVFVRRAHPVQTALVS